MQSLLNELYTAVVPILIAAFGTVLTIVLDRATKVLQWRVEQITRVQPAETAQKRVA